MERGSTWIARATEQGSAAWRTASRRSAAPSTSAQRRAVVHRCPAGYRPLRWPTRLSRASKRAPISRASKRALLIGWVDRQRRSAWTIQIKDPLPPSSSHPMRT